MLDPPPATTSSEPAETDLPDQPMGASGKMPTFFADLSAHVKATHPMTWKQMVSMYHQPISFSRYQQDDVTEENFTFAHWIRDCWGTSEYKLTTSPVNVIAAGIAQCKVGNPTLCVVCISDKKLQTEKVQKNVKNDKYRKSTPPWRRAKTQ